MNVTAVNRNVFLVGRIVVIFLALCLCLANLRAAYEDEAAYNKLRRVIGSIENYYVDDLKVKDIVDKAIEGLLNNLDAHSAYLNAKKFKDLKVATEGEFGGVGIQISLKDGALTIISPIDDTPGHRAGLKNGDIILKINDESTIGMHLDDAVNLMRGKKNTPVQLTIVRKGTLKPLVFDIVRDIISVKSVHSRSIENSKNIYIRVSSFDKKVSSTVTDIIKKHNPEGIILDLRNNPGGLLSQAVELSNLFIKKGLIVSQKGRMKEDNEEFSANALKALYPAKPLVVLVNGGSASASEIVAGALQDHKRALILGESTFGKGSVQVIFPLEKDEALRLTISRYYLPSGRAIQAVGVTPDVLVYPGAVPKEVNEFELKESDLKKHLESELSKLESENKDKQKDQQVDQKDGKDADKVKDKTQVHSTQAKKIDKGEKGDDSPLKAEEIDQDIQLKSAIDALTTMSIFSANALTTTNTKK